MHTAAAAEEDIGIQNSPLTMYIMLAQLHLQSAAALAAPSAAAAEQRTIVDVAIMHIKRYQHACYSCIKASRILKMKSCKIRHNSLRVNPLLWLNQIAPYLSHIFFLVHDFAH